MHLYWYTSCSLVGFLHKFSDHMSVFFNFSVFQIEVKRRNLLKKNSQKTMQFKVNDKSVNFFASGMSRAVLG